MCDAFAAKGASGHDVLLIRIRDVFRSNSTNSFPVAAVEKTVVAIGKSLAFDDAEIDELLNLKYGGQSTIAVLSALYPGLDLSSKFHEDHIFPKSRFTMKKLLAADIPLDRIDYYLTTVNLLPNLQLLAATANNEKQDELPTVWINTAFPDEGKRATYLAGNDLDGLLLGLSDFISFFEQRRQRIRARLLATLGSVPGAAEDGEVS